MTKNEKPSPDAKNVAKMKLSNEHVKSELANIDKKIVSELTKAFGDDVAYHIKESGPTWVNSPHDPAAEKVEKDIANRTIQVTVHNIEKSRKG